ncbi:MAG TPA: TolC family protein [Tenuifilaceae bacterium]|nr:TolC family protein [Tenuifilaceae bacterium]
MKKIVLFALAMEVLSGMAQAQDPWALEQCIQYANENNLQIKMGELSVNMSKDKLLQSKLSIYPSANLNANHAYSFGRVTNYITNQKESRNTQSTSFSFSSSMPLFEGFQLTNTKKQSNYDLLASIQDVETVKNNIALSVASAYLQILYQQELVEVAQRQVEQSEMQVKRTALLVNAGSLPEGNLYEVEALLASDELQLVNSRNQLDLAYLNLTQLLEIKDVENFRIAKPNISEVDSIAVIQNPQEIFTVAQQTMPQILGSQYKVQSSEMGLKIAKGANYPRLTLSGSYSSGAQSYLNNDNPLLTSDPFFTQIKDNASTSVGLSLGIPIFNGGSTRYRVSTARISLDNARLTLENEKNILYKDIQQAYADAIAAQKKHKASQKSKMASEESFRYTENKFNLGLLPAIDYTTARNNLAKAETDLLQAKYELVFKTKILDFYKGVPLSL